MQGKHTQVSCTFDALWSLYGVSRLCLSLTMSSPPGLTDVVPSRTHRCRPLQDSRMSSPPGPTDVVPSRTRLLTVYRSFTLTVLCHRPRTHCLGPLHARYFSTPSFFFSLTLFRGHSQPQSWSIHSHGTLITGSQYTATFPLGSGTAMSNF